MVMTCPPKSAAESEPCSVALLIIGRFPEQLLPVADLRFHIADAVEECGEVSDAMRLRGELEAGVAEQCEQFIDAFGRVVGFFPKFGRGALVRAAPLD